MCGGAKRTARKKVIARDKKKIEGKKNCIKDSPLRMPSKSLGIISSASRCNQTHCASTTHPALKIWSSFQRVDCGDCDISCDDDYEGPRGSVPWPNPLPLGVLSRILSWLCFHCGVFAILCLCVYLAWCGTFNLLLQLIRKVDWINATLYRHEQSGGWGFHQSEWRLVGSVGGSLCICSLWLLGYTPRPSPLSSLPKLCKAKISPLLTPPFF